MAKIGVFTCWCGENIARHVDCDAVSNAVAKLPGVHCSLNYKYMCSEPGQNMIADKIKELGLTGVVVASCSPHMHLKTFRKTAENAGLNPYLVEMANIREQCSWVHSDREIATAKAIELIGMAVEKVRRNHALEPIKVPVTKRALVIGAGVAGIQAALDVAAGGVEVVVVEKEPSVGGKMAGLSETFPTLDCSQCILTPRMVEVGQHPNIKLMTYCEVEKVEGFVGNFKATIRKKARYVDITKCTGCGACWNACPMKGKIDNAFDFNLGFGHDKKLGKRSAIYVPFPQAVPARPTVDAENCLRLKSMKNGKELCGICQKQCAANAINFHDQDELIEIEVGAIVVATGYQLYSIGKEQENPNIQGYAEYGYGKYKDVVDSLQFERIISASGPTGGEPLRPSDGRVPEKIVFIQCVGSRDNAKGITYCSKICCMYTAKHTMLYKHKVHDGEAHVFYMDIRSGGKKYDEFVRRAIEQDGAIYHRGRVSKIEEQTVDGVKKLMVYGADTLSGKPVVVEADMVVLACAMTPTTGAPQLAQKLSVGYDEYGFLSESHPKLRPVETNAAGVFVCGACQGPKDIPETVAQASAAAGKVLIMLSQPNLTREPEIASVDERLCASCGACVKACPFQAITKEEIRDRNGNLVKTTSRVNPGLCMGCGTCVAVCPSKSVDLIGFTDDQVYAQVESLAD